MKKSNNLFDNTKIQIFFSFSILWILYFLSLVILKELYYFDGISKLCESLVYISQKIWFFGNILLSIPLFGMGLLIHTISKKIKIFSLYYMILSTIILVSIDQVIQFFVVTYHNSIELIIIKDWISITPWMVKTKGTYISMGQLPLSIHILIYFFILPVGYLLFRFLYFFEKNRTSLYPAIVCAVAGYTCSFCSMILYQGTCYDYIRLYPLFVCDIKDVYLDIGTCLMLLSILQNRDVFNQIHLKNIKFFIIHEMNRIKYRINKELWIK